MIATVLAPSRPGTGLAWKTSAHTLARLALAQTDAAYQLRCRDLFGPLRRAAVSVEANIVEGYALGTTPQFRKHLRIAMGSAAETECLTRLAGELGYLPRAVVQDLESTLTTMRALHGLLRKLTHTAS